MLHASASVAYCHCCRPSKSSSKHLLHVEAATDYDDVADVSGRGDRSEQSMTQVWSTISIQEHDNDIMACIHPGQASLYCL